MMEDGAVRLKGWHRLLQLDGARACSWSGHALGVLVAACSLLVLTPAAGVAFASPARAQHLTHPRRGWGARSRYARAAIVGGSQISIGQAPWQVEIEAFVPVGESEFLELRCGGSILDATHILTAAHCVFNPETANPLPPEDFAVLAGTSDIEALKAAEPAEQEVGVGSVRVHPYFTYTAGPGAADDVAVLGLAEPLALSSAPGTTAASIGLAAAGTTTPEGDHVDLTGFGRQDAGERPNGRLYALGMTVGYSRQCGGEADALFVCASVATGSACSGDSGSGLTGPGSTPTLVGVTDTVEVLAGEPCRDGAFGGFVNVAAPEIADFIAGSGAPPRAPRGGGAIIRGVLSVGHSLTCEPGSWSNGPTFVYSFIDSSSGQVLQQGASPTYPLSATDVGRTILCQVQAVTAGGVGVGRTPALAAIKAAASPPPPPTSGVSAPQPAAEATNGETSGVELTDTTLMVQSGGVALVKLSCAMTEGCHGTLTLSAQSTSQGRGKKRHSHTVTVGTARFAVPGDGAVTVKIKLDASGRALLAAGRGRLNAHLAIIEPASNPAGAQTEDVRLVQQKAPRSKAGRHKR